MLLPDTKKNGAFDNGLTNAFTGTPGKGVNTQINSKSTPRFTSMVRQIQTTVKA